MATTLPNSARRRVSTSIALAPVVAALLVVIAVPAHAGALRQLIANLNAGQVTPPTTSTALGVAHFTYDQTTAMLCYSITSTAFGSAQILADIHGPADPGVAAPALLPLPLGNPKNGCVGPLDSTQKKALLKNQTYVDIHTTGFASGEIRGQILRIK